MTVIDVHSHMLAREYLELLNEYGAPQYRLTVNQDDLGFISSDGAPFFALTEPMWDAGLRIRDEDRAGVDLAILSLTCPNANFRGPAVSLQAAQIVNDFMAAVQCAYPDRFRWLAALQYPDLNR